MDRDLRARVVRPLAPSRRAALGGAVGAVLATLGKVGGGGGG